MISNLLNTLLALFMLISALGIGIIIGLVVKYYFKQRGTIMSRYTIQEVEEDFDTYDKAVEYCYEQDIIYYSRAMDYLHRNDNSLRESMQLASDLGCDLENISSETLATIHYQNYLIGEIMEIGSQNSDL